MTQQKQWTSATLGDLGRVVTGGTPPVDVGERFAGDLPFITPSDLGIGVRAPDVTRFVPAERIGGLARRIIPGGAVCFTCIGSIGKSCITPFSALTNQQINSLVIDDGAASAEFVYYLLGAERDRITHIASGTATPIINKAAFASVEVLVPPLQTQRKIAAVLSSYDDLIENNNRRIQILEEIAQRIYREWFVHFRYPGHEDVPMVESEIGPIPEGWEVATISAAVGHKRNSVTPQDFPSEDFRLLSIPAFDQGQRPEIVAGEEIQSGKFLLDRSSVLYSKLNPQTPRVWIAEVGGAMRTVVSSEFLVLEPIPPWTTTTAFLLLAQRKIARQVAACANGTSTSHQRIRPADLLSIQIPVPPRALLLQMDELTAPVVNLSTSLATQETLLRSTRDLLLPRLVSGELDVSDLDIQVPEAA